MRKKDFLTALLLAASSLAVLTAQTPTHSAPTPAQTVSRLVARLTTLLSLTTDQQAKATTIFTAEQTATSTIMTSLAAARTELQTAVEKDDTEVIATESTQIGTFTAQLTQAHATAQADFYLLLTSDQQTKYQQLLDNPGGQSGPGGPGGPGGDPGGRSGPGHSSF